MAPEPVQLMDERMVARAIARIAHELIDSHGDGRDLALVGIRTRGVPLAERLSAELRRITDVEVPVGRLDITLYRDDLTTIAPHPVVRETDIPFAAADRILVLVDDVLFTGRTVRAALDALVDFGRPNAIRLAVLVDRGHRELPIQADHVGRMVQTAPGDQVLVRLGETDGEDSVMLARGPTPT